MLTIWKYPLVIDDAQEVNLPRTAQALHVGEQEGRLTLWALVNPEEQRWPRTFYIVGTGNGFPDVPGGAKHLGTVQMRSGLVWHVFEEHVA